MLHCILKGELCFASSESQIYFILRYERFTKVLWFEPGETEKLEQYDFEENVDVGCVKYVLHGRKDHIRDIKVTWERYLFCMNSIVSARIANRKGPRSLFLYWSGKSFYDCRSDLFVNPEVWFLLKDTESK